MLRKGINGGHRSSKDYCRIRIQSNRYRPSSMIYKNPRRHLTTKAILNDDLLWESIEEPYETMSKISNQNQIIMKEDRKSLFDKSVKEVFLYLSGEKVLLCLDKIHISVEKFTNRVVTYISLLVEEGKKRLEGILRGGKKNNFKYTLRTSEGARYKISCY